MERGRLGGRLVFLGFGMVSFWWFNAVAVVAICSRWSGTVTMGAFDVSIRSGHTSVVHPSNIQYIIVVVLIEGGVHTPQTASYYSEDSSSDSVNSFLSSEPRLQQSTKTE